MSLVETVSADAPSAPRSARLSVILRALALKHRDGRVSIRDIMGALKQRSYGALIAFFGLPLVVPHVPGLSTILGAPLIYLGIWLMLGKRQPWLPAFIADRSFAGGTFANIVEKIAPWLDKAEAVLKPRWKPWTGALGRRAAGVMLLVLAIVLILPIPFGNMLPGLAATLFGFALLARDGVMAALAWMASIASLVLVTGIVWALILATLYVISAALGMA
jgi:hypothetical protein